MKIVFIAPFGLRPKGTVFARMLPLAKELQCLDNELLIVVPPYTNPEDSGREELVSGIRIKNITLPQFTSSALAAPIIAWRIYSSVLSEKPDIVHLFKPKGFGGLAVQLLARLEPEISIFVDTDDWEGKGGMNDLHAYSLPERMLFEYQERRLPKLASAVSVASRVLQERISGFGIPEDRILYLPNCVAAEAPGEGSSVRSRLGIAVNQLVLLLYTRFFEFSQEHLAWLFADLARRSPDLFFLVVGKGSRGEDAYLRQHAEQAGYSDRLHMTGWLDPEDIPDYLAAGDVAVYPFADTPVNRSKCPAKLTQLLAAGIPVVAHRVGMISEYIQNDVTGVLCEKDDWESMSDRVLSLLSNPQHRELLGKSAKQCILKDFSWAPYAKRLADVYDKFSSNGLHRNML